MKKSVDEFCRQQVEKAVVTPAQNIVKLARNCFDLIVLDQEEAGCLIRTADFEVISYRDVPRLD